MNYQEAVDYILDVPKFTSKNKPENTKALMKALGNPQDNQKVIHVAGTNGKGSTCAFLSSILMTGGKTVGLFTSPHLISINERFQVNGKPILDELFLQAFHQVMKAVEEIRGKGFGHPTFFELVFAMAMVIFQREKVEYIILETGMGGRLDATNVVEHPLATVITTIGLDHTEILGDTIEKIAGEKAGILKAGVPVIYDARDKQSAGVIEARADFLGCSCFPFSEEMYKISLNNEKTIDFSLNNGYYEYTDFTLPFPADYQVVNASLALLTIEVLDGGHEIGMEARQKGISDTKWKGRMETVMPGVILDGAHNPDGIRELIKTLRRLEKNHRITLLFSAVAEKEIGEMVRQLCEETKISSVIVTEVHNSRNVPVSGLKELFLKYTEVPVKAEPVIEKAFLEGLKEKEDGLLVCVGSLYLIGELERIIKERYHD